MAEPSMPTAHTSGSALWVRRRHQRVAPAPVTTPRKPVKQVMAPKMRLQRQRTVGRGLRGQSWGTGADRTPHHPPPACPLAPTPGPGPTCPWPHRAGCCRFLPSSARLGRGAGRAESTCRGPLWRRTRPTWPGRRRRSCGWREAGAATLSGGLAPLQPAGPRRQASALTPSPQGQKASDTFPAGSGAEGSGFRNHEH